MKIIFMGTPDFAVPALDALHRAGHEIPLVFSQPDKPSGRGQKIHPSPVKSYALAHGLRVEQPFSLRKGDDSVKSLELIKELNPDIIIVAAYGQILPRIVLDAPRLGCVNIHASLLPRWRGASPINYCIMSGDKESGVTIMRMEEGIDTGGMFLSERCEITDEMNSRELHDKLKEIGARLITRFAENPEKYIKNMTAQNYAEATYAPMITKEMKKIDLNKSALEIYNFIRGLTGEAYCMLGEKRLKVFSSEIIEKSDIFNHKAGTITESLEIICGDMKILRMLEIKPEGKNKMSAEEFLRGVRN
ncbi:MAG: methionyl-tRNA formyltransferase [Oscillospiraceae bacterium]|nr:methionyl-tRNA formyltransferase [Oscillospiraceae bacterium]